MCEALDNLGFFLTEAWIYANRSVLLSRSSFNPKPAN